MFENPKYLTRGVQDTIPGWLVKNSRYLRIRPPIDILSMRFLRGQSFF